MFLAACSGADDRFLSSPDSDAASFVTIVHTAPPSIVARDTSDPWSATFALEDPSAVVDVLAYACPLDALKLPAGRLTPSPTGQALPRADRTFTTTLDGADEWATLDPAPARLTELRVALPERRDCADVDLDRVVLPGVRGVPRILVALGDDEVLLGLRDGELYRVHRDGTFEHVFVGQRQQHPYVAAARVRDGTLYFATSDTGCFGVAHDFETIDPLVCPPASEADRGTWIQMDAGTTAAGIDEVFASFETGEIFVVRDGALTDLTVDDVTPTDRKAAVLRLGDGEALFAGPLKDSVIRYVDGRTELERASIIFFDQLVGLGATTAYGPVALTNSGALLGHKSGAWTQIASSGAARPHYVVDVEGRLFVDSEAAVGVVEILPDLSVCPFEPIEQTESLRMIKLGDDGFALVVNPRDGDVRVTFVRPRFSGASCDERL